MAEPTVPEEAVAGAIEAALEEAYVSPPHTVAVVGSATLVILPVIARLMLLPDPRPGHPSPPTGSKVTRRMPLSAHIDVASAELPASTLRQRCASKRTGSGS